MASDADGSNAWVRIVLDPKVVPDMTDGMWERVIAEPFMSGEGSSEVEKLQQGICICGRTLGADTVILSNSGGNLAVVCSTECLDDFMAVAFLSHMLESVNTVIQTRGGHDG